MLPRMLDLYHASRDDLIKAVLVQRDQIADLERRRHARTTERRAHERPAMIRAVAVGATILRRTKRFV